MVYYKIPQEDLDKYIPPINDSIAKGLEFLLLDKLNSRYFTKTAYTWKEYLATADYTMDSYNKLKICMPESTARVNSMLNGIEYILESYLNCPKMKNKLDVLYSEDDERDD